MNELHALARQLRQFDADGTITKKLRTELRGPVPAVRARIKAAAIGTLPAGGGLNIWVAQTKITASVVMRGRSAGVLMRGGRRSVANLRGTTAGGQTDVRAIDRGRLRHPRWGHRRRGDWFTQAVTPGFFTKTAAEAPEWEGAVDRAVASALEDLGA